VDLPAPYDELQTGRCTISKFFAQLYGHVMSAELFGKSKEELEGLLLRSVDKWVELTSAVYPAQPRCNKPGWFWSWNKRCGLIIIRTGSDFPTVLHFCESYSPPPCPPPAPVSYTGFLTFAQVVPALCVAASPSIPCRWAAAVRKPV
jgi:hypothetical protein